jgi:hypothetical protein
MRGRCLEAVGAAEVPMTEIMVLRLASALVPGEFTTLTVRRGCCEHGRGSQDRSGEPDLQNIWRNDHETLK